ncbi:MAG: type IV pilus assembly protein PilM [Elusimicrobia bacterium]|nr:type IV pilus assembly protein PilM [Elusimicrobiota bacterium]
MPDLKSLLSKIRTTFVGPVELLGLDIGSYAVKAVMLQTDKQGCRLLNWAYAPLGLKADASPEERKLVASKTIMDILSAKAMDKRPVAVSVSGNSVIVRYVKLNKYTRQELEPIIASEAEPYIPFDIREVNLAFHILRELEEEGKRKIEIALVAAKKQLLDEHLDIVTSAGLLPLVVDVDAFALESLNEKLGNTEEGPAVMLLNIGHKVTNVAILEKGLTRVSRDIFAAGLAFNKAIAKNLKTDLLSAEQLKHKWGLSAERSPAEADLQIIPGAGKPSVIAGEDVAAGIADAGSSPEPSRADQEKQQVSAALREVLKDLVNETRRSVDFYLSQGHKRSIKKILLGGGSANLKNLPEFLAAELKVPVEILNPMAIKSNVLAEEPPADVLPDLCVATGLALRQVGDAAK